MLNRIKNYFRGKKEEPLKMDLQEFISEALMQVCNGIKDAQDKTSKKEIEENVKDYFEAYIVPYNPIEKSALYKVDFDITIGLQKKTNKKLGISVISSDLGFGFAKNKDNINSVTSRMKFTIPVIYPSVPNKL